MHLEFRILYRHLKSSLFFIQQTGTTVKNGVNTPIKANAPGRKKMRKLAKNGANAPGRLDLLYQYFIEERPGYVANAPGRSFSRFFERKAPWGEPTTREGVRKVPTTEAVRDASQHAVDRIA